MDNAPPIGDLRLLGDGRGALLITPGAEVVWWCTPRFDSDPTFWSLLDNDGAAARFVDVRPLDRSTEPAGATTWTRLQTLSGTVEVRDCLVDGELIRLVSAISGQVDVCLSVSFPTFGSGTPAADQPMRLRAPSGDAVAVSITPGEVALVDATDAAARCDAAEHKFRRQARVHATSAQRDRVHDAFAVISLL
nr:hypothetical protein [Actinomycetota bacterium]